MAAQDEHPSLQKRSLEDIAATQAEHTLLLTRIVDRLDEMFDELNIHTEMLRELLAKLEKQ
jgi:Mg2+ and Co2+ transporter CorA